MYQTILLTALVCVIPSIMAFVYFWLLISAKIAVVTDCETRSAEMARRLDDMQRSVSDVDIPRYEAVLARIADVDKATVMVGSRVEGLQEQFVALINRMNARDRTERKKARDEERDDEKEDKPTYEQTEFLPQFAQPMAAPAPDSGRTKARKFGAMPNHLTQQAQRG